jgi:phosphate/sulfate permease
MIVACRSHRVNARLPLDSGIFHSLGMTSLIFLILTLGLAFSFEFVNGFHDTANAVATVIYTNSLKPTYAVVWSGLWNLIGVLLSAGTVAFGILALLPVELVINVGSGAGFAMVFALLISAIIWNVGTWYFGLPASSSHTLIGSIVGVGLANSVLSAGHQFGDGVNWGKVQDTLVALLVSPLIGFTFSALLLLVMKYFVKKPELFSEPNKDAPPSPWVRGLLILTCTGVSFAHGSNDGQKGMGLIRPRSRSTSASAAKISRQSFHRTRRRKRSFTSWPEAIRYRRRKLRTRSTRFSKVAARSRRICIRRSTKRIRKSVRC